VLPFASLAFMGCGDRPAPTDARPLVLRDVSAQKGVRLALERAEPGRWFMPDSMAGGCALLDADGDGDLDAFLAHGLWRAGRPVDGGLGRLLLQTDDGRFRDGSAAAGVIGPHYGMGVAAGDVDNDGDLDLYVSCYGPDRLLTGRGDGTFEDASERAGVGCPAWGASVTFLDYDADGWLDVYVANYLAFEPDEESRDARGDPEFPSPGNYPGAPDTLLRNRGDGTFEDVSVASGVGGASGKGLGVAAGDFDGDGRVDIYVANDGEANHCWVQAADGRFEERALAMGLAFSGDGRAEAGMGIARGDVDGDGAEDLLLTHLVQQTHTLYCSSGAGRDADGTLRAGLAAPTVDATGFGAVLADLDLDGFLDAIFVHGRVLRGPIDAHASESARWKAYAERDLVLLGDGARFTPVSCGDFVEVVETGRGLALGDLDGDGDLDALTTTADGGVRLYENAGAPRGAWIAARAVLPEHGGRDAYGAVVTCEVAGLVQRRVVQPCHGYLSSGEPCVRFGLGDADAAAVLTVRWPDGMTESFDGEAGRVLTLRRGAGR
jgi:hypothetical protein